MTADALALDDICKEFAGVDLGDARRNARLLKVAKRVSAAPADSFPKVLPSDSELEALYRLLRNDAVDWEAILAPHVAATVQRGVAQGLTRVVHDTTDFVFSGDRDGMGPVIGQTKGFFGHFALAVSGDEARVPLGVAGLSPWVRRPRGRAPLNQRKMDARRTPRVEKESYRWETLAKATSARFPTTDVVHVMDQEADDFVLMAEMLNAGLRFVIRGSRDRLLYREGPSVASQLAATDPVVFRTVPLSMREAHRSAKQRKAHPPRREREASLCLRWTAVELDKPQHAQSDIDAVLLWAVEVFEPSPPPDEVAISWTLFTNEVVDDVESATTVVDHYRARWRIEEYFRALKQGCALQQRQLESYGTITNALALFIPIAWRLLLLRSVGQADIEHPAQEMFESDEVETLRVLLDHKGCRPLPAAATVRDMMLAIAQLGGHIKNNGEPGWIVLGRGFEELLKATLVWRAAEAAAAKRRGRKM